MAHVSIDVSAARVDHYSGVVVWTARYCDLAPATVRRMAHRGHTGTSMGGQITYRKRRKQPKVDPGVPKAGPVTVTKADGSIEIQPANSRAEVTKMVRAAKRRGPASPS